jgi:alpha-beta hydrolase superfamily lysophospholipase
MPLLASTLRTPDGLALAAEHHVRPGCRAVVTLVHGYAEHTGRYAGLVAALDGAGYAVHLFDLRGHGRSGGVRGHVRHFAEYLDDLDLLRERVDQVQPREPGRLRLLVGHSLGGLIALCYVLRRPDAFDALAVLSPYLQLAIAPPRLKLALAGLASRLFPTLLMSSDLEAGGLSHDPAVIAAYVADPLVFKTVNPRWFFETRRAQRELLARAGEIRLPLLMQLGGADPIADPAASRRLFDRLGSADRRLEVYPGLLHELLNEVERARVERDLLAWLDAHAAASSSTKP